MKTTQILVIISLSCLLISLVSSLIPKIPIIVKNVLFLMAVILLATSQVIKYKPKEYKLDQKGWNEILAKQRLNKQNLHFSNLADKLEAKEITNLPSARTLWIGSTEDDIDSLPSVHLPKKYMIKANHGSGWNILVDLDKEKPDWKKIQTKCKNWLNSKYSNTELHYHDITPLIFAEEFIDILGELKFHCFNGQVVLIEHLRNGNLSECAWYSRDWEKLNIQGADAVYSDTSPKPKKLKEIIHHTESEISQLGLLEYVRYDLILLKNEYIFFSEYTLTPNCLHKNTLKPHSFEQLLGSFLESKKNDLQKLKLYVEKFLPLPRDSPLNTSFPQNLTENPLVHVVMVCTPNYYKYGAYGLNTMKLYCDTHGYLFSFVDKPIEGLHVNFTKNSAALDLIGKSPAKFILNCDADIEIKDMGKPLTDVFDSENDKYIMQAPRDEYSKKGESESIINAGFVVWRNCPRAKEINQLWINTSKTDCKNEANTHPRQQNVFDKCVYPTLSKYELNFLDPKLVGMPYSSFISQTKKSEQGWINAGRPQGPIAITEDVPKSFYINLDQDVVNRRHMEKIVKPYLPTLTRVPGVLNDIGLEGCRRAHINAQKAGLQATSPGQYYIVLEDDAIPNVSRDIFHQYIKKCQQTGADLILFNVQNQPDSAILRPTLSPEFYRIFGGTGSGLAYMVKHEFGEKLISCWEKHPKKHIDWTWHKLFPMHKVLLHRPLLFLHAQGESKIAEYGWRDSSDVVVQDFDWSRINLFNQISF